MEGIPGQHYLFATLFLNNQKQSLLCRDQNIALRPEHVQSPYRKVSVTSLLSDIGRARKQAALGTSIMTDLNKLIAIGTKEKQDSIIQNLCCEYKMNQIAFHNSNGLRARYLVRGYGWTAAEDNFEKCASIPLHFINWYWWRQFKWHAWCNSQYSYVQMNQRLYLPKKGQNIILLREVIDSEQRRWFRIIQLRVWLIVKIVRR